MKFGKTKPEVLVVGAGPVGLFAAVELAKRGIRVEIIDKDWRTGAHSYALALHPRSLALFRDLGLLDEVLAEAHLVETIGMYEGGERKAEVTTPSGSECGGLVAVLRQDTLESLLEGTLKSLGVSVHWNHELSDIESRPDGARATVDRLVKETVGYAVAHTEWTIGKTFRLDVPYVIGADGIRSTVRRRLGFDFAPAGQTEHFAVFECLTDSDQRHEMKVAFAGDGSLNVLWPMQDKCCRWSFQLTDDMAPEDSRTKDRLSVDLGAERFPVLSEAHLQEFLRERAPWFDATIRAVLWRIVVRFERRMASRFGQDRVWLAGDAGHVTGPVGMQSMNVGLSEAHQLAGTIADILREGASPDRLEEYNSGRITEWNRLLGLKDAFRPDDSADPWVGQFSDQLLPCLPASGDELEELAGQLGLKAV